MTPARMQPPRPAEALATVAAETRGLVAAVIPTYRAERSIRRVVARALEVVDIVIVVDDACPQNSGALVDTADPRVHLVRHPVNRGVGGATKTGIAEALRLDAEYIVKIDADDQMDTSYVPHMIEILDRYPEIDLIKGNRFGDPVTLTTMPAIRLLGNAILTLLIKFSSGYWTVVDPSNGFIALRTSAVRDIDLDRLAERYFFESDLLCSFGMRRRVIAELEMPAIYGDEKSSLSIPRVVLSFPFKLMRRFVRRVVINYLVVEINVGSLCAIIGLPLLIFATVFGAHEWSLSITQQVGRPTGTIIAALLLFIIGFQLSLQALLYDVQFSTRTVKLRRDRKHPAPMGDVYFR